MPIDEAKAAEVKGFPCESCGAQLTYAAGTSSLKCSNCGHLNQIQFERAAVVEYDLAQLEPATTNHGFGVETRNFKCGQCAATTSFPSGLTSTKCAFCGSDVVVQTPSSPHLVRPETLIPFQFDKNIAVQKFRAWLKGLWFRPSDLNKMAAVADISGAYTPFFTFDASALSDWTGEAGFYYYVQEQYYDAQAKQNRTRQVRKVRWEWRNGRHKEFYNDELICASRGMPWKLMQRIYPFQLDALVPYKEDFLAGWPAEEYSIDPKESWGIAQQIFKDKELAACSGELGGDTQRSLSVQTRFSGVKWKHLLLPVYVAAYRYRGKPYHFLVNGQTGEVSGDAPLSWWKIAGLVALILVLVGIIFLLNQR